MVSPGALLATNTSGLMAYIHDGDRIAIDIPACSVQLKVSDEELAERRKTWVCKEPSITTGYMKRYVKLVAGADKGAILE